MRPVPTESVTSLDGRTAAGWAWAGAGAAAASPAARTAATAVPIEARRIELSFFILLGSHRNDGDVVAAGDTDRGTSRRGRLGRAVIAARVRVGRGRLRRRRDGAALEARDV